MKKALLASVLAFPLATGALSQTNSGPSSQLTITTGCAARNVVLTMIESYTERRVLQALNQNLDLVEVFTNQETQTWTITLSLPDGRTCVVLAGQGFIVVDESLGDTF